MLLMSLWMGQAAHTDSRLVVSLAMGVLSVGLACLGGSILTGVFEPEAIPDEQLRPLTSIILVAMFVIGVTTLLFMFYLT